jgi:hypothetical protein
MYVRRPVASARMRFVAGTQTANVRTALWMAQHQPALGLGPRDPGEGCRLLDGRCCGHPAVLPNPLGRVRGGGKDRQQLPQGCAAHRNHRRSVGSRRQERVDRPRAFVATQSPHVIA